MKMLSKLQLCLLASILGGASSWAAPFLPLPTQLSLDAIPVCYDFGCKHQTVVSLPPDEWASVAGWFASATTANTTPAQEREQIRQAIGWMETVIGRHSPTHKDLAFDLPPNDDAAMRTQLFPGQLDCIDEAVNTISYLKLFEMHGLLKHHVVIQPAYRRALLDQHWAGQIQETQSGARYVVDSWFQPNGYLPVVQHSKQWENINPLTAVVDNSAGSPEQETNRSFWHRWLRGE